MKTNIVIDILPSISYLAKFRFSSYGPKCCWPIKLQDSLKCNISRKKWMMKFIFGMQINIEVFNRHTQSTQNKNFAYLCNISRRMWGMKLIFCLQVNTKVFCKLIESLWVCVARYVQSTQNKFAISFAISQGKREGWTWFFACRYTLKVFLNWYYHFRCACLARHAQITHSQYRKKSERWTWFFACR